MNEETKLRATLEMVCNIFNNCEGTLDGEQDPEYLLTSEGFIQRVVEQYHTNNV